MAMLEVKNIGISFGGLKAVDNFSLTIEKGQLSLDQTAQVRLPFSIC